MDNTTYERMRFITVFEGQVIELDGIHLPTDLWPTLIAGKPSFTAWRVAHLPSGWTVAVEPLDIALARFREGCLPNTSAVDRG